MTIHLSLPWPPSINGYWRSYQGRNILSKKGREYKKTVAGIVAVNNAAKHISGRLAVRVWLHPPTKARRDIDNSLKALLDAMQAAGVYLDDEQIDSLHIQRMGVIKGGIAHVEIAQ